MALGGRLWQASDVTSLLTLGLVPVIRPGRLVGDRGRNSERKFLDFKADEEQLGPLIAARVGLIDCANEYASVLVTNWPAGFPAGEVRQLLGEAASPLRDGRIPLYVCAECGGLGCGAVTAVIEHENDAVVWHSLARQTDYDSFVDDEPFEDLGPFRFHSAGYNALLRRLLAENVSA
jgi:hypothetical protein